MKKTAFMLVVSMFAAIGISGISLAVLTEFTDVSDSHENYEAIKYVRSQGVVSGYEDNTFKPDRQINRAEFTKIVVEAVYEKTEINQCIEKLTDALMGDVPLDTWFAKYVCVATNHEIVGGYPDGTFKPEQNIAFVEAAKIIAIAFGHKVEAQAAGEEWFSQYVKYLEMKKAIPASIDGFGKQISRGEMAEIIYRLHAEITDKPVKTYNQLAGFADVPQQIEKIFNVKAKQFEFEPAVITVNHGDRVKLIVESLDVDHGISIPEFGVKQVIGAGETTTVEFVADKVGEFEFFCSVYCGSGHSLMEGKLIVK